MGKLFIQRNKLLAQMKAIKSLRGTTRRDKETVAVVWLDMGLGRVNESLQWLYKHLHGKTDTDVEDKMGA